MFATSFEAEERSFKTKKTSAALVVTVFIHGAILLFMFLTLLTTPNPPLEENDGGMAVNFGTDDIGMGDVQPLSYDPGITESAPSALAANNPADAAPEDVLSDDNGDENVVVPKVEPAKKPKEKPNPNTTFKPTKAVKSNNSTSKVTTENTAPPTPKADDNAMFHKGAYGKPNNSTGDGTGNKPGDQGDPNGDPNSKNYLGNNGIGDKPGSGVFGNGNKWSLKNRQMVKHPDIKSYPCPATNTSINIIITVDRNGKVIDAQYTPKDSKSSDECLIQFAKTIARQYQFDANPNADEAQRGTTLIRFGIK